MPVSNQTPLNEYVGNGSVTEFTYEFQLLSQDDILVFVNGTQEVTGFTVTGVGDSDGGSVVFIEAPASGAVLRLQRFVATDRDTDYQAGAALSSQVLDNDLDRIVMMVQDLNEAAIKTDGSGSFDAVGERIINVGTPVAASDAATKNYVDTAPSSQTAIAAGHAADADASADAAAASATAAAGSAVSADASADASAASAVESASSASASASSATAALNSETAAGNSATAASNSAGVATTQATAAAASATSAANSETAAGTSETNAAASESASALSESNAAASATAASTSETNAAGSASAAATSATNASNSATAAAGSATDAASSASAALGSEINADLSATFAGDAWDGAVASKNAAATSETNAAASATAANGYLTNFRNQWGAAGTVDPTLDGNGNPLTGGDLYYNLDLNEIRVYTGASWFNMSSGPNAVAKTGDTMTGNLVVNANVDADTLTAGTGRFGGAVYGGVGFRTAAYGGTGPNALRDGLVIESSGSTGLTFLTGNTANPGIAFGDPESNVAGQIRYSHLDQLMDFIVEGQIVAVATSSTLRLNGCPYGTLGVRQGGAYGGTGPNSTIDDFVIENSGHAGISVLTPNTSTAQIRFGDPENNASGGMLYNHLNDTLSLVTNATTSMYLNSAGGVLSGNLELVGGSFHGVTADSATAPSYSWAGDTNTGMYRAGVDTIGFSVGGSSVWHLNASGQLSTSIVEPTIGSTTAKFHIAGTTALFSTSMAVSRFSNDAAGPVFLFGKTRGGSIGTNTAVTSSDDLGSIRWHGGDGTDANSLSARIRCVAAQPFTTTNAPGQIEFGGINNGTTVFSTRMILNAFGHTTPGADNTSAFGSAGLRWSVVYAATGAINTSDARTKTAVADFSTAELEAAKSLSKEIGTFKFLDAVAAKGAAARLHIGMTVQRAIEIMQSFGLDPMQYGIVCYDEWGEERNTEGELVVAAGDRYGFRTDELLMFIARGVEARLAAIEAAL